MRTIIKWFVKLFIPALLVTILAMGLAFPVLAAGYWMPTRAPTLDVTAILTIVAGLVGLPALFSVLYDILKWAGIVTDGNAAKWSAAVNLIILVGVVVATQFFPNFNVSTVDNKLVEVAKLASLLVGYFIQLIDAKGVHLLTSKVLGIKAFSFSSP